MSSFLFSLVYVPRYNDTHEVALFKVRASAYDYSSSSRMLSLYAVRAQYHLGLRGGYKNSSGGGRHADTTLPAGCKENAPMVYRRSARDPNGLFRAHWQPFL